MRVAVMGGSGDRSFAALQWLCEHDPAKIPPISD
jgi:hypothetical protein